MSDVTKNKGVLFLATSWKEAADNAPKGEGKGKGAPATLAPEVQQIVQAKTAEGDPDFVALTKMKMDWMMHQAKVIPLSFGESQALVELRKQEEALKNQLSQVRKSIDEEEKKDIQGLNNRSVYQFVSDIFDAFANENKVSKNLASASGVAKALGLDWSKVHGSAGTTENGQEVHTEGEDTEAN